MERKIKTRNASPNGYNPKDEERKRFETEFKDFIEECNKIKLLTTDEEIALLEKIKKGDEKAKEQLVAANMRFVISVVKQFLGMGVPADKLIDCGVIGLFLAVDYRVRKDSRFKFIAYAVWYIRRTIMDELKENGTEEAKLFCLKEERKHETDVILDNYFKQNPLPSDIQKALDSLPEYERKLICAIKGIGMEKMSEEDICNKLDIQLEEQYRMTRIIKDKIKGIIDLK